MIPALDADGWLPLGRHPATVDEVRNRFVGDPIYAASATRPEVWAHWEEATGGIRSIVPICAAWLSGSFISSKLDPDDLDVVYMLDARDVWPIHVAGGGPANALSVVAGNLVRQATGLRLDTFIVTWDPLALDRALAKLSTSTYYADRGQWDDFWTRRRSGPKGSRAPEDILPRRGYVEVVLDGWRA